MCNWESYIMYAGKLELEEFWRSYYASTARKVLFVMGKGFDPRMNNNIKLFTQVTTNLSIECVLIDYPAINVIGDNEFTQRNMEELKKLSVDKGFNINKNVKADFSGRYEKGIRELCSRLCGAIPDDITDVIVDISSIPRAIYFNVVRIIFSKINNNDKNLFVVVSENVSIDKTIKESSYKEVGPIWGFKAKKERVGILDFINVVIPILGEGKLDMLERIINAVEPKDAYTILPFPASDPRRSDNLLLEYGGILNDKLELCSQNIVYVHEQNPFELYNILRRLISDYKKALEPLKTKIFFGVSILASKLLSLGALLTALELPDDIVIYHVITESYEIGMEYDNLMGLNEKSKPYLIWIKGEAYDEK